MSISQQSVNSDYAKAFRIIRAAFGLKQSELAERLSISPGQLSLVEAGKRQPSVGVIDRMAKAVGIPTALIAILASEPGEMEKTPDANVSDLARALLRLLVGANDKPRQSLTLMNTE